METAATTTKGIYDVLQPRWADVRDVPHENCALVLPPYVHLAGEGAVGEPVATFGFMFLAGHCLFVSRIFTLG